MFSAFLRSDLKGTFATEKKKEFEVPCCEEEYYDTSDYKRSDSEGVFIGKLMYTQWGKHHQKIAFIDLEDGRKIVCATSNRDRNFLGLREMAYGTKVQITLKRSRKGVIYLADLVDLDEQEWQQENGLSAL